MRRERSGARGVHSTEVLPLLAPHDFVHRKVLFPALIIPIVLVVDFVSKRWALDALADGRVLETLGGLMPLTLAFNKGAAFGLSVGDDSRWLFVPITFIALGLLIALYRQTAADDRVRLMALSLVAAGALGNLYDRVRWSNGVVDFFGPVDLGFWNFPIFNVADIAISCGAILLALSFWAEERRERAAAVAAGGAASASGASSAGGGAGSGDAAPGDAADAVG